MLAPRKMRYLSPILPEPAFQMSLSPEALATLSGVSTATITTVLLKKGLRNVWMRGTKPLRPGQPRLVGPAFTRSEERRVGKECRSRGRPYHQKKKESNELTGKAAVTSSATPSDNVIYRNIE